MQDDGETSLRERKRLATAAAIEEAAVRLVLERGYGTVTVDEICEAANISRRTFFNYFPSKEAAVLGPTTGIPDPEAADEFLSRPSSDLVADTVAVALATLDKATTSDALLSARMDLMNTDPLMLQAQLSGFDRLDDGLTNLLTEHLTRYPEERRLVETLSINDEARLIVTVANSAMRFAMRTWLESGRGAGRADLTRSSVGLLHQLFGEG